MNPIEYLSNQVSALGAKITMPRILAISVIFNLGLAVTLFYLWRTKPAPPLNDASKLITQNQEVLDDMRRQLEALQTQHQKNFDEYNRQISAVVDDYNTKIASLEATRKGEIKKIVEAHKGDIAGLAKDFADTMNIKLGSTK